MLEFLLPEYSAAIIGETEREVLQQVVMTMLLVTLQRENEDEIRSVR